MIFDPDIFRLSILANSLSYISAYYLKDANLAPLTKGIMTRWGSQQTKERIKAFNSYDAFYGSDEYDCLKKEVSDLYPMLAFAGAAMKCDDNKNFFMALRVCGLIQPNVPDYYDIHLRAEALDYLQTLAPIFDRVIFNKPDEEYKTGLFLSMNDDTFYQTYGTRPQMITADLECSMDRSYNAALAGSIGWLTSDAGLNALNNEFPGCRFISTRIHFNLEWLKKDFRKNLLRRIQREKFVQKYKKTKASAAGFKVMRRAGRP